MRRLLLTLAALTIIVAACGGDDAEGGGGSTFETVTALNAELAAADIDCALEYEGLKDADKEISTCVIDGEQATLNIWFNDDLRRAIIDASGNTVAYGDNWTVQVATPETATRLAEALDGSTGEAA